MRASLAVVTALVIAGCGSSVPPPNNEYAVAQQELGRAQEAGAAAVPEADAHYKLAQEYLDKANERINGEHKDYERAQVLITRSRAESELAMELTRKVRAQRGLAQSQAKLNALPPPGQAIGPAPTPEQTAPATIPPADQPKNEAPKKAP
jgi:hypothetical protein